MTKQPAGVARPGWVAEAARELARFDHYPPETNGRDGNCLVCRVLVPAGAGVICLGHDDSGTFAAPLHHSCAARVDAEHKRQDAARQASRERDQQV